MENAKEPVTRGVYLKAVAQEDGKFFSRDGKEWLSFNAYHTHYKRGDDGKFVANGTDFYNVKVWGASAKHLAPRVKKGMGLALYGATQEHSYTTKAGETRTETIFFADDVSLQLNQPGIKSIDFSAPEKKAPAPKPKAPEMER